MIPVSDLIKWAEEHAIGRSPSYPHGWVSGKELRMLSVQVDQNEPLNFYYSTRSNLQEEVYDKYTGTAGNLH